VPVGNRNDTFGETKNKDGRSEVEMRPITKGVLTRCGAEERRPVPKHLHASAS
jgi:hypothetical protein